jgi:hypothetical protein
VDRREIIDELLEQLESELDELNNAQLSTILSEYEHIQILGGVIESLSVDVEDEDDSDEEDEEDLPLIDGDWSDETDED